jgi:putative acetyltransferase
MTTNRTIRLRPAAPGDAPAIGSVFDAAVRAGWSYLGELVAEPMFSLRDWEQLVAEHAPPRVLLVAIDDIDGVVGFAAAHPADCEMFLLFVHPQHAGRGVGRILLDAVHDALRAAGCRTAFLFTHEQNERALAVYAAAGYRPDGSDRVSDFRGVRLRELRLIKHL